MLTSMVKKKSLEKLGGRGGAGREEATFGQGF